LLAGAVFSTIVHGFLILHLHYKKARTLQSFDVGRESGIPGAEPAAKAAGIGRDVSDREEFEAVQTGCGA
jgi:hypothetical protein